MRSSSSDWSDVSSSTGAASSSAAWLTSASVVAARAGGTRNVPAGVEHECAVLRPRAPGLNVVCITFPANNRVCAWECGVRREACCRASELHATSKFDILWRPRHPTPPSIQIGVWFTQQNSCACGIEAGVGQEKTSGEKVVKKERRASTRPAHQLVSVVLQSSSNLE